MRHLPMLLAWVLLTSATAASADDLATLAERMTGSFSSAAQAQEDEDFYDIRLEMVRIWPDRQDGIWLYVEQAAAARLERPYRQRVYQVTGPQDGVFESRVFTFESPLRFAGHWQKDKPLAALTPDSLLVREGCSVFLRWADGVFEGSTHDNDCHSKLRGASYATSEVTVHPDRIVSWDRGYDADGQQVWGAEKGGYVFMRESHRKE